MRRISFIKTVFFSLFISANAFAADIGPYIGAGLGIGILKTPGDYAYNTSAQSNSKSRGGISGRASVGMNFNKFIGIEAGYAKYASSKYKGSINNNHSSLSYRSRAYDVVGKGYLPVGYTGLSVYALAGAARVLQSMQYQNTAVPLSGSIATPNVGTTHVYKTRPKYGAGLNYDFNSNFATNFEFSQVRSLGSFRSNPASIPNMNLLALNLAYKFS